MNHSEMERQARRETLLKLAAAGALGAGGILGLVRDALSAGSLPATPGFRHIKGPVGVDATRASIGLNIKPGQSVMTGVGGEAVYIVGPDAFLQREKTKITFEESGGAQFLRVITGSVLSVIGKGRDRERNLQIVTPTATIGIRGTGCYIEAEEARTYFCLCYGEAEVTPKGDPKLKETIKTK
ncbi:MAG: FecR domain-containing protein, partial [Rhodocyclaceae bacterium]|nr:FecR domain-containing protein [Rhodocyclaceae bacterium]